MKLIEHTAKEAFEKNSKKVKKTGVSPIIMCIGVGGGGSNVVNYMHEKGIKDVTLIITNTDQQALEESNIPLKLQLGPNTTHGLGAGANPEVGAVAALESKEEISKMLTKQIKMVFITAGMGGGTGTGAAPIIASMAKEKDMLVIGVVTTPFRFEGNKKQRIAEEGMRSLEQYCDTLIVIENERLMHRPNDTQELSLRTAFGLVDQVLYEAVTSITDPINEPGVINVDFRDIDTMLRDAGNAVMGTGTAEGEDRGMRAVQQAIDSPLIRHGDIKGSTRLLLSVASGVDGELTLAELSKITNHISEMLGNEDMMVIWGHSYAQGLGNKIRVSIIASGFPESKPITNMRQKSSSTLSEEKIKTLKRPPSSNQQRTYIQATSPADSHTTLGTTLSEEELFEKKKKNWQNRAKQRAEQIALGEENHLTEKEVKELFSVPTYKRKGISLSYVSLEDKPPVRHLLQKATEE